MTDRRGEHDPELLEPIDPSTLIPPEGGVPGEPADELEPGAPGTLPTPGDKAPPPLIPGRGRALLAGGFLVSLLLILLFVIKDNETTVNLKVGDCFDIPTSSTVRNVTQHSCTDAHTGEVFLVTTYTGTETSQPSTVTIDQFVTSTCDPAVKGYVGKALTDLPDLVIGYFYPSADAWDHGDRTVTCYVARADEAPMATSLRGSVNP